MIGTKLGHDVEPTAEERAPLAVDLPDAIPVELLRS
jgi:hypothetical protein